MRRSIMLMGLALATSMSVAPAKAQEFVLEKYFAGKTRAVGSFRAINGVNRSFKVDLTGKWNGKRLLLQEDFIYSDGERDRKAWRVQKTGVNTYLGTREDVIGKADVRVKDDTARFSYDVYLDGENRKNRVRFHDTMTLKDNGRMINNAWVTKFGIPVARTRVEFQR